MEKTTYRTACRKRIRTIMAHFDLSERELAEKAGLSYSYVRGLISGTHANTVGRQKIEKALGYKIWSDQENGSDPEAGQ